MRGSSQQFIEEGTQAPLADYHNDVGGKDWWVRGTSQQFTEEGAQAPQEVLV